MSETNKNSTMGNMKYVLIIIGIVAIVLSYFLVYSKYNKKISNIDKVIDTLEVRKDDLESKNGNKDLVVSNMEKVNNEYETLLKKFSSDITYQSQIMDKYNMSQALGIQLPVLGLTEVAEEYTFGQIATSNPNGGVGGMSADYKGVVMTYSISTLGTYAQMTDTIKYLLNENGKRKVPLTISFTYDSTTQQVALIISAKEYAVVGGDRKVPEISIPGSPKSVPNIFYNEIITQ